MSNHCCSALPPAQDKRFKRVLWFALWVNGLMFCIELFAGFQANSASLLADAVDFFSDTVNYAISLAVVGSSLLARSGAALFKGITMALYGFGILGKVAYSAWVGHTPEAMTMGTIGLLALVANVVVAYFLFRYREGDANQRSIWLCSRNDAIGNIAVIAAALGVFGTQQGWPDLLVALIMASLGISAAYSVIRQSRQERKKALQEQLA